MKTEFKENGKRYVPDLFSKERYSLKMYKKNGAVVAPGTNIGTIWLCDNKKRHIETGAKKEFIIKCFCTLELQNV